MAFASSGFAPRVGIELPSLVDRFKRPSELELEQATGLVVLGGGEDRLIEAARLARRHQHLRIFCSGAGDGPYLVSIFSPSADLSRLAYETKSKTTYENAVNTAAILRPGATELWVLVTSAYHMPRAVGAFRQQGMDVRTWPVYDYDSDVALPVSNRRHEWLGLIGYWVLQQSSSLLPAEVPLVVHSVLLARR